MIGVLRGWLPWLHRQKTTQKIQGNQTSEADITPGGIVETPWVAVASNIAPLEAEVMRGRLESEGIPAIAQQDAIGAIYGLTVGPLGSAKVSVPEIYAERARRLLAETFEENEDNQS